MEGKFTEAIAAFHQAREIDPKHPHVAGRLAEVERQQQQEASAMALARATC
jgi:cytochrome c-type biogenesis protein CcmH/NrfG